MSSRRARRRAAVRSAAGARLLLHDAPLAPRRRRHGACRHGKTPRRGGCDRQRGRSGRAYRARVDPRSRATMSATVEIALAQPIAADLHADNPRTGRLVLEVDGRIAGGGLCARDRGRESGTRRQRVGGRRCPRPIFCVACRRVSGSRACAARSTGKSSSPTSFGLEDQVIFHLLAGEGADSDIDVVTLDTGRLFRETYDLWARDRAPLWPAHPRRLSGGATISKRSVRQYGINGFYEHGRPRGLLPRAQGRAARAGAASLARRGLDRRPARPTSRAAARAPRW